MVESVALNWRSGTAALLRGTYRVLAEQRNRHWLENTGQRVIQTLKLEQQPRLCSYPQQYTARRLRQRSGERGSYRLPVTHVPACAVKEQHCVQGADLTS